MKNIKKLALFFAKFLMLSKKQSQNNINYSSLTITLTVSFDAKFQIGNTTDQFQSRISNHFGNYWSTKIHYDFITTTNNYSIFVNNYCENVGEYFELEVRDDQEEVIFYNKFDIPVKHGDNKWFRFELFKLDNLVFFKERANRAKSTTFNRAALI
jgi:hypothetical protein